MRFDLELTKSDNIERAFITILSRYPRSFGRIRALVDTGSPKTIICPKDSVLLHLPLRNATEDKPITGLGKGKIPSKKIESFRITLISKDNQLKDFEIPIYLADTTAINNMQKELIENAYKMPSIIGMDFLRVARMKLVIDIPKEEAFLECED